MGSPPGWGKLATDPRHDQFAFVSQIAVEDDGIRALAKLLDFRSIARVLG
jgi:hypothetical protein